MGRKTSPVPLRTPTIWTPEELGRSDSQGQPVFLYKMSDLPTTEYRTRNYPNPYVDANHIVTQIGDGPNGPFEAADWNGNSRHAEWQELRRQAAGATGTCAKAERTWIAGDPTCQGAGEGVQTILPT
jgi:hypothetical protein